MFDCCLLLFSGASIGDGQSAVASNIANTTYRLQWWDFTKFDLPEISNGSKAFSPFVRASYSLLFRDAADLLQTSVTQLEEKGFNSCFSYSNIH